MKTSAIFKHILKAFLFSLLTGEAFFTSTIGFAQNPLFVGHARETYALSVSTFLTTSIYADIQRQPLGDHKISELFSEREKLILDFRTTPHATSQIDNDLRHLGYQITKINVKIINQFEALVFPNDLEQPQGVGKLYFDLMSQFEGQYKKVAADFYRGGDEGAHLSIRHWLTPTNPITGVSSDALVTSEDRDPLIEVVPETLEYLANGSMNIRDKASTMHGWFDRIANFFVDELVITYEGGEVIREKKGLLVSGFLAGVSSSFVVGMSSWIFSLHTFVDYIPIIGALVFYAVFYYANHSLVPISNKSMPIDSFRDVYLNLGKSFLFKPYQKFIRSLKMKSPSGYLQSFTETMFQQAIIFRLMLEHDGQFRRLTSCDKTLFK